MPALPPAIFGIGRNYVDHAREMGGERPERPVVFMKNPASVIGDGEPIVIPRACVEGGAQVDFEGELAVIIGRPVRDVAEDEALDAVASYAIANDVSARWWQRHGAGGQFVRGKSFDTFCPLGAPVPAERVDDPQQ
ncbi:MAG: fumarylacetoacetate hydrolase family protein, partial [Planctomycetota bacterium]